MMEISLPKGRVIKGIGGFYTVMTESGLLLEGKARGRLRLGSELLVGDWVRYDLSEEGKCTIEEILPRELVLKRPYIANVTQVALVFALKDPDYNTFLIDRFLTLVEDSGLRIILVFNKADLIRPCDAKKLATIYQSLGYSVQITSTITRQGKVLMQRALKSQTTVFAGPSGVGKSALLNMVCPGHRLQTGQVSAKIGRGRHTTRQVQLLPLSADAYVADTPGFTQIDLDFLEPDEVSSLFPEFSRVGACKFRGCFHLLEPGCAVKAAVESGEIPEFRYQHYLEFLAEVRKNHDRRYH
jgi:ribosome biogenesis GTPase